MSALATRDPRQHGFSLIELLVVLAILAILIGIAAGRLPRDRLAVNQAAEGLARDYQYIRLEAIRRNEFVGLAVDPANNRYVVFVDMDRDLVQGDDDFPVKTVNVGSDGVLIDSTNMGPLVFDPRGLNPTPFVSELAVQLNNNSSDYPKTVCVTNQGRVRVRAATGCDS